MRHSAQQSQYRYITDSDDKEQTFTLYVGGRDESDAYNYVQMDGSKMVNTMTKETVNNILNIEE